MPATAISQPGSMQRGSQNAASASGSHSKTSEPGQAERSSQEDIAKLAYALWQRRGSPEGSPEADWVAAEQELSLHANTKER